MRLARAILRGTTSPLVTKGMYKEAVRPTLAYGCRCFYLGEIGGESAYGTLRIQEPLDPKRGMAPNRYLQKTARQSCLNEGSVRLSSTGTPSTNSHGEQEQASWAHPYALTMSSRCRRTVPTSGRLSASWRQHFFATLQIARDIPRASNRGGLGGRLPFETNTATRLS